MIKEATASTFLLTRGAGGWEVGLIDHPRLRRWMTPGGHVEEDETTEEAAVREVFEETGLVGFRLVHANTPMFPDGYPHKPVAAPWWTSEKPVPGDRSCPDPHVHVDYEYVAYVTGRTPAGEPAHPFRWVPVAELDGLRMFDDTRLLLRRLVPQMNGFLR